MIQDFLRLLKKEGKGKISVQQRLERVYRYKKKLNYFRGAKFPKWCVGGRPIDG